MQIGKIENIVSVASDGGMAHPDIKDGHIIPVLIVDCANNGALIDLCHLHQDMPPGDVSAVWTWKLLSKRYVYLKLEFIKPVKVTASIKFDVRKQGGLVCGIISNHAFYLQPLAFGAKVSEGFGKSNILIEVPSKVVPPNWNASFEDQMVKRYRQEGYDRTQARQAAKQYMKRANEAWLLRAPRAKHDVLPKGEMTDQ